MVEEEKSKVREDIEKKEKELRQAQYVVVHAPEII